MTFGAGFRGQTGWGSRQFQPDVMPEAITGTWQSVMGDFSAKSHSLTVGLFQLSGQVVYVNPGMEELLFPPGQAVQGLERFMSPTFDALVEEVKSAELPASDNETGGSGPRLAHTGWIQFGTLSEFSRSIFAQIWRHEGQLLLIGEHDVTQLLQVEQDVLLLNGRLNELQRELAVKNHKLTQILTELRETQAMLIHSEKMNAMGHLVAGVAHEVNNPVAFVASNLHGMKAAVSDLADALGDLEIIARQQEVPDRAKAVEDVLEEYEVEFALEDLEEALGASLHGLDRVKKLVENLRTFSRHDEADFKVMDVRESLDSTLALLEPELRNKVTVNVDLPALPPIPCFGAQLGQVFMNLILNAAQAMGGTGTITITGEDRPKEIRLHLTDSGPGIPPDVLPKIFNAFYTTKPVGSGTGLGLYLCYKIITEDHKGQITAASEPGQGAVFTIALPKESND